MKWVKHFPVLLFAVGQFSFLGFQRIQAADTSSSVIAWGDNSFGQTNVPSGLSNVVAVAAGGYHNLVLTSNRQVFGWGRDDFGQATTLNGLTNVVAIAAGGYHSLALTADGRVIGSGLNDYGQATLPAGVTNVVRVAASVFNSAVLTMRGEVVSWGNVPPTPNGLSNLVSIASDGTILFAITSTNSVIPWWSDDDCDLSNWSSGLSNVVALAVRGENAVALTDRGLVEGWGCDYADGLMTIPTGLSNVVSVAAGSRLALALTSAGRVVAWGDDFANRRTVANSLSNTMLIASGWYHCLAVIGNGATNASAQLSHARLAGSALHATLPTQVGKSYSFERKDSLNENTWTFLRLFAGDGIPAEISVSIDTRPMQFYRARPIP